MDKHTFRGVTVRGLSSLLAVLAVGCRPDPVAVRSERGVCEGVNAAVSPDGSKIAFQRLDSGVMKVGVCGLSDGAVSWVESGPGMAAFPAWTPSGGLVYMYGDDRKTAFEVNRDGDTACYGLRILENGIKRDLTRGRCRDYTPCVSPDGHLVYFTSTRWVRPTSKVFSTASTCGIGCVDLAGGDTELLMDTPGGRDTGFCQPAVSPDGKILVWGHLRHFFMEGWRIYGAKVSDLSKPKWCPVTPRGLVAMAPRWHPNGKVICFMGYRKDDPGWGVWVEDVQSGAVRRLCSGRNPAFSPDGTFLVYDRDQCVYRRSYGAADDPNAAPVSFDEGLDPERVVFSYGKQVERSVALPATKEIFAVGANRPVFFRVRFKWDGTPAFRMLAACRYEESEQGFQVFHSGSAWWFSSRNTENVFVGVKWPAAISPGEHELTGVRLGDALYLSLDGEDPVFEGVLPSALDRPVRLDIAQGLRPGEYVRSVEFGTGWPGNVRRGNMREDLFK